MVAATATTATTINTVPVRREVGGGGTAGSRVPAPMGNLRGDGGNAPVIRTPVDGGRRSVFFRTWSRASQRRPSPIALFGRAHDISPYTAGPCSVPHVFRSSRSRKPFSFRCAVVNRLSGARSDGRWTTHVGPENGHQNTREYSLRAEMSENPCSPHDKRRRLVERRLEKT